MPELFEDSEKNAPHQEIKPDFAKFLTMSAEMFCAVNFRGYFQYLNPAGETILGYNKKEILDRPFIEFFPKEERSSIQEKIQSLAKEEKTIYFESRFQSKDGSEKLLSWTVASVISEQIYYAVARDITPLKKASERLQKLSKAIEAATDGIAILNEKQEYIYVNKAHALTYGYENSEQFIGKTWAKLYPEAELKRLSAEIMPEFYSKGWWCGEAIGLKKDGSTYPQEVCLTALEEGGLISVVRDISDRHRREKAIYETEARYQILTEASPVGIFYINPLGNCLYVNESFCEITGISPKDALGKGWVRALHPEDRERILDRWYRSTEDNLLFKSEYRFQHPDGAVKWVVGEAVAQKTETGQIISYVATITDITEQKRAEEKIKQLNETLESRVAERTSELETTNKKLLEEIKSRQVAENKYREISHLQKAIIDGANCTIISTDLTGIIQTINRTTEQWLGYSAGEVVGKIKLDFFHDLEELKTVAVTIAKELGEQIEVGFEVLVAEARKGIVSENEWSYIRQDGSRFSVLLSVTPLLNSYGNITGFLAIGTDISDRKKAEEDLRRSNKELEQFAYVASHDLQEPLRTMTSYAQLLAKRYQNRLDDKADKYINYIVDGASRMQQLINDLLTYSRVGKQHIEFEPTDCNLVLQRTLANLEIAISETGAIITSETLPTVMADGRQLLQLFQNLIANGIKFCREHTPAVRIFAVRQDTEWLFGVRDNGIGIEPEYAQRIFVIFQRLHSRQEYSGTGIGLALCQRIVEGHGGRIWVESQLGKGATFYFTIPRI